MNKEGNTGGIDDLIARIDALEDDLQAHFEKRREEFAYRLEHHRVIFEREARRRHRELRTALLAYVRRTSLLTIITAPFIYAMIVPLVLLDLAVIIYQAVCFPVYGIARVPRRNHIVIDRHQLAYLNGIEKLNCAYCGYANGLISWVREVAARTEQYWCPIKHARRVSGSHTRYHRFLDFGDGEAWQTGLKDLRRALREERAGQEGRAQG